MEHKTSRKTVHIRQLCPGQPLPYFRYKPEAAANRSDSGKKPICFWSTSIKRLSPTFSARLLRYFAKISSTCKFTMKETKQELTCLLTQVCLYLLWLLSESVFNYAVFVLVNYFMCLILKCEDAERYCK